MIAANTFGSGVEDILDLSGNNNPFSQATSGSRGAWFREPKRGRVNLVLRSQEIDQSPWTVTNLNRTANATIAPDGTLTADKIFADTTAAATHNVRQTVVVTSGSNLTFSFYAKAAEYNFIRFWEDAVTGQQGFFNLSTGVATNSTLVSVGMEDAGNGWWRCFGRLNSFGGTNFGFRLHPTPDGTTTVYNGDGVSGVFVWQCQLEVGTVPTAPQRVTTAFDVTEAGQRDCYGVRADGTDDWYQTAGNVDFSGTPRVTVFAAVRKLSDAASGTVVELSSNAASNDGAFLLRAPWTATPGYGFFVRGTTSTSQAITSSGAVAPITNIIRGQVDISANLTELFIDGTLAATSSASLGGGNFRNDILYLFRRGGTSIPFNGNLYALIVAGGSYPLSTIQRVERILSRITPTVNL
jgi:hypothetical protein